MSLQDAIRGWRNRAGKSQREVAEALGLEQTRISDIERGHRSLKFEEAARFAEFCGLSSDDWWKLRALVAPVHSRQVTP